MGSLMQWVYFGKGWSHISRERERERERGEIQYTYIGGKYKIYLHEL
jgi:hypothetical protein